MHAHKEVVPTSPIGDDDTPTDDDVKTPSKASPTMSPTVSGTNFGNKKPIGDDDTPTDDDLKTPSKASPTMSPTVSGTDFGNKKPIGDDDTPTDDDVQTPSKASPTLSPTVSGTLSPTVSGTDFGKAKPIDDDVSTSSDLDTFDKGDMMSFAASIVFVMFVVAFASYGYKKKCSRSHESSQPYNLVPVSEPDNDMENGKRSSNYELANSLQEDDRDHWGGEEGEDDWGEHSPTTTNRPHVDEVKVQSGRGGGDPADDVGSLEWAIRESLREQDKPLHNGNVTRESNEKIHIHSESIRINVQDSPKRSGIKETRETEKNEKREEMKRAREQRMQKAKEDKARRQGQKDHETAATNLPQVPPPKSEEVNLIDVEWFANNSTANSAKESAEDVFEEKVTAEDLAEMGLPSHMIEKMLNLGSKSTSMPSTVRQKPVNGASTIRVPQEDTAASVRTLSGGSDDGDLLDDDGDGWGSNEDGDGW
jgi:hypothetical protein